MPVAVWLESAAQDARQAVRALRQSRATLWIALLTLALGIGAVTAVFSAVDRILFRELPYPNADRLVWFGVRAPINPSEFLLEGSYWEFRQHQTVFDEIASLSRAGDCDINERDPARLACGAVSASFLSTFGVRPILGRDFTREEDQRNGPSAAILTYGLWQSRYGGDPHVLGRAINVDGRAAQIVGVLPRNFEMPNLARVDLLLPQQLNIAPHIAGTFLYAYGRLKAGVTLDQARAALQAIYRETLKDVPPQFLREVSFSISPLRDRQVRDHRAAAAALFGCVCGLLLIACANVASLLLARAAAREREMAVRSAIGAGRGRLARQAVIESLVLSGAGVAAGLALAAALLRGFRALAPEGIPRLADASLDWRVLGFALGLCFVCALVVGLAPALQRPRLEALNLARTTGRGLGLRQALVAVQICLSLSLLSGAGLLLRSLSNLERVPLGMNPEHVLAAQIHLSDQYRTEAQRQAFYDRALDSVRELPGLRSAAMSDSLPLSGPPFQIILNHMQLEGRPPADLKLGTGGMVVMRTVTPGYFASMGVRIVAGRAFTEADRAVEEQAVVIGENLARRMFPGEDPIGRRFKPFVEVPRWRWIVGVAADAKNSALTGKDLPEFYAVWRSATDGNRRRAYLILRTDANPRMIADLVRSSLARLDPSLPVTIQSMEQVLGKQVEKPRFQTYLLALFALIGVVLAAVGQFGVIAAMVSQRSGEIGVRMALGATGRDIIALVVRHAISWTAAGAVAGVAGAWWGARFLQSLLFGVKPGDAGAFAAALVVLAAVSILAAWAPARRAARLDPAQVLRHD